MNREERNKFNYERNHKIINETLHKWCNNCKKWLPMKKEYWYTWNRSKDGYASQCKSCVKTSRSKYQTENWNKCYAIQRKWAKENRDYVNQRFAKWEAKNPYRQNYKKNYLIKNKDKLLKYNKKRNQKKHIITNEEWIACKNYFNNACAYCGLPAEKHYKIVNGVPRIEDLHKEHVINDGRRDIKNCIPSCNKCNNKKKKRTLNQFYNPKNKDYTYERYHKIYLWIRYDYKKYIQSKRLQKSNIKDN